MHFWILKENLYKALTIVGRNISSKPQLPVLSNILLQAENGQLKITTTNMDLGIIITTPAKIEKTGEITVPGKLLTEFVSMLSADKVEFMLEGTNLLVKTDKNQASFSTISASDFPASPTFTPPKNTFLFKKIKDAITRTVFAASIDEGRPVLTGVKTTLQNGKMTLTATDGYRLSQEHVDIPGKNEELKINLPAHTLSEVVRIAQELKSEEIGFSVIENKNQAIFNLPGATVFTRIIDGEFPNIEKIIPAGFKTRATIDRDQFAQAVKTASLFARGAANIIKIKIEKEGLRLSANTPQVGQNEDFVEAKIEGEESEIAFNYRFLLDLLANFPDESLVFESSGPLNPGVFRPLPAQVGSKPTPSFFHIIMPVRVQG